MANRVNKKSSPAGPFEISVVDAHSAHVAKEPFFHNQIEALFAVNGIGFRWLIQSQAQSGPTSAVARNIDPNRFFFLGFGQYPDNLLPSGICHFKHVISF